MDLETWRVNYGLDRDPHDLAEFWRGYTPTGAVLALKAAVSEIERLNAQLAEAKQDRQQAWKANEKLLTKLAEMRDAALEVVSWDWCGLRLTPGHVDWVAAQRDVDALEKALAGKEDE